MNLQRISEPSFEEVYVMPGESTVSSLLLRCADADVASGHLPCQSTRHLVTVLEYLCRREMQDCIDEGSGFVRTASVRIEHSRALPNMPLRLRGWVEQIADGGGTRFRVQAADAAGLVCDAAIGLEITAGPAGPGRWRTVSAALAAAPRRAAAYA